MKTLISAVLALTLLGTAGASAQSWRGDGQDHFAQGRGFSDRGFQDRNWQDRGWHTNYRRDSRGGVNNEVGLGLFALAAILASQSQAQHAPVYDNGYYGR